MIIQCPSCSTKFSVEQSRIRELSNPRFHCSRCDHYFDLSGRERPQQTGVTAKTVEPDAQQLDLLPTPSKEEQSYSARYLSTVLDDEEELPKVTAQWPSHDSNTTYEADMRGVLGSDHGFPWQAGHIDKEAEHTLASFRIPHPEEPKGLTVRETGSFVPIIETKTEMLVSDFGRFELEAPSLPPEPAPPEEDISEQLLNRDLGPRTPRAVVPFPQKVTQATKPVRSFSLGEVPPPQQPAPRALPSRPTFLPAAGLLSLPLALTAGFALYGNVLANAAFGAIGAENLDRVAPEGMEIVGLRAEPVSLEDGSRVLEVRGSVVNGTERQYRDLTIEAKLYDEQNREISRAKVPASNGLSHVERISSLRKENIQELQTKVGLSRPLRTNELMPFRAVVTELPPNAAYFATRILGVRRSS